jgi:hypothetical protein
MSNFRHYFAIENQLKKAGFQFHRSDLIKQYTGDRKTSLADLSQKEYAGFIGWLRSAHHGTINATAPKKAPNKMVSTSIHYLCLMGMVTADNKPDYDRINLFIRNMGSNNPNKAMLHQMDDATLNRVVTQIKAMYQKEVTR